MTQPQKNPSRKWGRLPLPGKKIELRAVPAIMEPPALQPAPALDDTGLGQAYGRALGTSLPALAMAAVATDQFIRARGLALEFSPAALGDLVAESYRQTGNIDDIEHYLQGPAADMIEDLMESRPAGDNSTLYIRGICGGWQTEWRPKAPAP